MTWVFLEIVAALAVAVGIVWWTMPRRKRDEVKPGERKDGDGAA